MGAQEQLDHQVALVSQETQEARETMVILVSLDSLVTQDATDSQELQVHQASTSVHCERVSLLL